MTNGQPSDPEQRLTTARAALRALLAQVDTTGGAVAPQVRASVVQLQAVIAAEKAALRGTGSAVADAPEDTVGLPSADMTAINNASNQGAQGTFYGSVAITVVNREGQGAPAPDPYAQYRAYLLRLLPPLDTHAQPYLGLQTFQFEHADRFFGRDRLVAELAERLGRAPFLAVLGASGSGKSSVVRAGLLPLLKAGGLPGSERWQYITLRPGARPLDALAAALSEAHASSLVETLELAPRLAADPGALLLLARRFAPCLVLVVDQAEELWTLQPTDPEPRASWQEQQQRPFLRLLLSALEAPDRPLLVILALRADFLHSTADDPLFARALTDHDIMVSPMTQEELRAAIELPARQAGGGFEPGLVEELIAQAQGGEGVLPLLEYTLQELWNQRQDDGVMTWASYRALGGVEGALAKRADSILQQHYNLAQQGVVRRVLLRLIQPGEGAADTRRRVALADLVAVDQSPEALQLLLQPLIDARLLTTKQEHGQLAVVEISHETLIRSWPTLRGWIDEARVDLRIQIQLEEVAKEWVTSGSDKSLLWDGLRLSNAEAWFQRAQPRLSARDNLFLEASRAEVRLQSEAIAQVERDRQHLAAEQRNAQRLRRFLIGSGLLLLMTIFATLVATISRSQVAAANDLIDAQRLAYAAQSQIADNPETALLLAAEATQRVQNSISEQALRNALDTYPAHTRIFSGHTDDLISATFSPDGQRVLTTSRDKTARVWSKDGKILAILQGHTGAVTLARFSPDGQHILTASEDSTARIWSIDGKLLAVLKGHTDALEDAQFSPDGQRIATASYDQTGRLWNLDGSLIATLRGHSSVVSISFNTSGQRILTKSLDYTAHLWNSNGDLLADFREIDNDRVYVASFSPDGLKLLISARSGRTRVFDQNGLLLSELKEGDSDTWNARFSPDNNYIITSSIDNKARLWSVNGTLLLTIQGHRSEVEDAGFTSDGGIFTVSEGLTRFWNRDGVLLAITQGIGVRFSIDERMIVTSTSESIKVWDRDFLFSPAQEDSLVAELPVSNNKNIILYGYMILTYSDKTARIWNFEHIFQENTQIDDFYSKNTLFGINKVQTEHTISNTVIIKRKDGTEQAKLQGHTGYISSTAFSRDSSRIVTASADRTARVWRTDGIQIAILQGHTGSIHSASFSPDGQRIVTASEDGTAIVWSINGELLTTLQGHTSSVQNAQFSPDGKRIVTASEDGTARVWSVDGYILATLRGHTRGVSSAQFSPDGQRIVTASPDKTVRIWDIYGSIQFILRISEPARTVYTLTPWSLDRQLYAVFLNATYTPFAAFSLDGRRITVFTIQGPRMFPAQIDDLLAEAACRLPRNLTPDEIQRFDVDTPHFDRTKYQCPPKIGP